MKALGAFFTGYMIHVLVGWQWLSMLVMNHQ